MKVPKSIISRRVLKTFEKIYRQNELEDQLNAYYEDKIKKSLLIALAGTVIFLALVINENKYDSSFLEKLIRNDYYEGKRTVSFEWSFDKSFKKENTNRIDYSLAERKYTDSELEMIKDDFLEELSNEIVNDNLSLEHVDGDMKFVSKIKGYPFAISYMTDKPLVISSKGVVDTSKISEEGEIVVICLDLKYDDYFEKEYIPVCVYSQEKTSKEVINNAVLEEIIRSDNSTKYDEEMNLPKAVFGENIYFRNIKKNTSVYVLALTFVFSLAVFFAKDNELNDLLHKREKDLNNDYARMVNKFVLFYNAGFSVNVIWQKLCTAYENVLNSGGERHPVYEEMLVTRSMINEGLNELDAYEDFGMRCGLPKYKLFSSLICQAVVKGKNDMNEVLKNEADKAFVEQKNNAKRLSEEAGTKLLIPMFMMLAIVMIMVMMPAFKSFGG